MFFFKKKPKAKVVAYLTKMLKYKNILKQFQENDEAKHIILLYFFEQTKKDMSLLLKGAGLDQKEMSVNGLLAEGFNFLDAREISNQALPKADLLYALELHPLFSVNQTPLVALSQNGQMELTYFTGLDEAVMAAFQMDRVVHLMEKLGIKDDESIEHSMVSKSIERGQTKLESSLKSVVDIRTSQEEWLSANSVGHGAH